MHELHRYVCLAGKVCTQLCIVYFFVFAPVDGVEYFREKGMFSCFYVSRSHPCGHGLGSYVLTGYVFSKVRNEQRSNVGAMG
jgi:hypothetical protein